MNRSARWALTATLVVCAVLIACRTLFGPWTSPLPMRSPMNVESFFGLAAILLLLIRAAPDSPATSPPRGGLDRRDAAALLAITLLVACVFWRTTHFYFLSDDFILVRHARSWHGFRNAFTMIGADGFYRPITFAYLAWVATWAGLDPALWHRIELALHAANSCLVFLLGRALGLPRIAACFAAALFAVHASRPEAVVWIAGRADLLATLFVLLALVFFIRSWDASGRMSVLYRCVSLAAMTLALISKESSYTFPLLLVVFLAARRGLNRRRDWFAVAPFFLVAACLFAWRWTLLGGIGGYRDAAGRPQALSVGFIPVLKTFALRLWAVLFFPIDWDIQPGAVLAIVTILYLAALIWLSTAETPRRQLAVAIGLLAALALPPVQQLLMGADLQKARYLYLPSVGFCLLLAAAVTCLKPRPRWAVSIAVLAFHLTALFHNLSAWEYASEKAKSACAAAAACAAGGDGKIAALGVPGSLNGVYLFANGFPDCVAMQPGSATIAAELVETIPEPGKYSCVLWWDTSSDQLRRR